MIIILLNSRYLYRIQPIHGVIGLSMWRFSGVGVGWEAGYIGHHNNSSQQLIATTHRNNTSQPLITTTHHNHSSQASFNLYPSIGILRLIHDKLDVQLINDMTIHQIKILHFIIKNNMKFDRCSQ
jgi:hypothetical protein